MNSKIIYGEISMINVKTDRLQSALQNVYRWLDCHGVLKNTATRYFRDRKAKTICFEIDTQYLEPYRELILNSGIPDADIATKELFKEPDKSDCCEICGSVVINGFKNTRHRCSMCENINHVMDSYVRDLAEKRGRDAVRDYVWGYINYVPFSGHMVDINLDYDYDY